jgi:uncharacterized protein (DUF1015 family)
MLGGDTMVRAMALRNLHINQIRRDFQPEECLLEAVVAQYVAAMQRNEKIEPIRVFFDGTEYWLADGFHRVAAALQLSHEQIKADVTPGTYADMEAEWRQMVEALKRSLRER